MAVFTILAADSAGAVAGGHCAIADATFLDPLHRGMLENAARSAGVPFLGLWLRAPLAELERRIAARTRDASDATIAVLRQAARHDPGPGTWHPIEAADPAAVLDLARAALHAHIVPR